MICKAVHKIAELFVDSRKVLTIAVRRQNAFAVYGKIIVSNLCFLSSWTSIEDCVWLKGCVQLS